jgi:MoaA/NifB/PqqE/SkfB family radical SAM enzyme
MAPSRYTSADFDHSPLVVFYEMTRACNLKCVHCRADAQRRRDPNELDTETAKLLFCQFAQFPKPPLLVLTGGDPLKRPDVFELIAHARSIGLDVAMTPSATPLVTSDVVHRLHDAGLHRLAVSLDGKDAATHDGFRRVPGSFARTLRIINDARACGLPVQVNTTIARHNADQVDEIAELLGPMKIVLWSVFFLIPTGRALAEQRIAPEDYEVLFEKLSRHAGRHSYAIKTTEAPHYRRFLLQRAAASGAARPAPSPMIGTNDGKGVLFISHVGEICPTGFLPIECGRFPADSVVRVYQESPLFRSLRDPDQLKGKCGVCDFRAICGGSRARAYALTGDPLAAEPDCAYVPPRWEFHGTEERAVEAGCVAMTEA